MEGLKFIDSLKIPGIIIAIFYMIYQKRFFSIIKSSDIERLFFSHEKKKIYNSYNWLMLFMISSLLITCISFVMRYLYTNYKLFSNLQLEIAFNIIFIVITLASILLFLFREKDKIRTFLERLNENENSVLAVFIIYYVIIILSLAYTIGTKSEFKNNIELMIVFSSVIISLFIPGFLKVVISPWIFKEKTLFYFEIDGIEWYILKSHRYNEFIIGDNYSENDCQKIMFISYEELKKNVINIQKKKVKSSAFFVQSDNI